MTDALLWCSLAISITSILLAVASAVASLRLASRVIQLSKRKPPSESTLAKLVSDQTALFSSFESMATTVKRISSRSGMQERRSKPDVSEAPEVGASKTALRRHYGLNISGPEFARRQMNLVPKE